MSVTASSTRRRRPKQPVQLTLGRRVGGSLPPIGLGTPSHDEPLDSKAVELLASMHPAHLRVPIPARADAASVALTAATGLADRLGTHLQLVLEVDADGTTELEPRQLETLAHRVADVIVLASDREATGAEHIGRVRVRFAPVLSSALFHGGTDLFFCELNRATLDASGLDGVSYSVNPQVHAFDDASLFETLAAQAQTVTCARRLFPGLRVLVGPVTLRPRSTPVRSPDRLPRQVDVRQLSLLGAAWTLGSVRALAGAGADALTYYEPTGWRGLIERAAGPPLPELFPSRPGEVFPLYHVLADASQLAGELLEYEASEPLATAAFAVADRGSLTMLIANLQPEPTEIKVGPLPVSLRRIRRLNEESALLAATEPLAFRSRWDEIKSSADALRLRLEPYETARLEAV